MAEESAEHFVAVVHGSGFHVVLARHEGKEAEWPTAFGPFALLDNAEEAAGQLRESGWLTEVIPTYGGDTIAEVTLPGIGE